MLYKVSHEEIAEMLIDQFGREDMPKGGKKKMLILPIKKKEKNGVEDEKIDKADSVISIQISIFLFCTLTIEYVWLYYVVIHQMYNMI